MKTTFQKLSLLVQIGLTTIIFSSCSKSDPDPQPVVPVCRIVSISSTGETPYQITYTTDGKINTVSQGDILSTFVYTSNGFTRNWTQAGAFFGKDIYTLNANGLCINHRIEQNEVGTVWSNDAYEFTGDVPTKMTVTQSSNSPSYASFFTWSNGNWVKTTSSDDPIIITMDHYLDKPYAQGDYFYFEQVTQGTVYQNKNLIKSFTNGSFIQNYTYTFDDSGKIISMSIGNTTTYNYTYQCN
jgi:hypothetical protein